MLTEGQKPVALLLVDVVVAEELDHLCQREQDLRRGGGGLLRAEVRGAGRQGGEGEEYREEYVQQTRPTCPELARNGFRLRRRRPGAPLATSLWALESLPSPADWYPPYQEMGLPPTSPTYFLRQNSTK